MKEGEIYKVYKFKLTGFRSLTISYYYSTKITLVSNQLMTKEWRISLTALMIHYWSLLKEYSLCFAYICVYESLYDTFFIEYNMDIMCHRLISGCIFSYFP